MRHIGASFGSGVCINDKPSIDLSNVSSLELSAKISAFTTWVQSHVELISGGVATRRRPLAKFFAQGAGGFPMLTPAYQSYSFPMAGQGDSGGFDITDVTELEIRFVGPGATVDAFIDGLGTTPIPEPASGLLLLGGLCSCLAFLRRPIRKRLTT